MAEIVTKTISAGDPVTSDLINNIIADLRAINKESASQSIILQNALDPKGDNKVVAVSSKVYSTTISGAQVNPAKTPSYSSSWTFPDKTFTKPPRCWIQVNSGGAKLTEPQTRIHIIITSITSTKMTFEVRSGAGATSGKMNFDLFAVEA